MQKACHQARGEKAKKRESKRPQVWWGGSGAAVCVELRTQSLRTKAVYQWEAEGRMSSTEEPFPVVCLAAQSCLSLCDPIDCSLPGSSVHGILQTRILQWVAMPSSGDLPDPGIKPVCLISPALAGKFFTTSDTWPWKVPE